MIETVKLLGREKYSAIENLQIRDIDFDRLPHDILHHTQELYSNEQLDKSYKVDNSDGTALYVLEEKLRPVLRELNGVTYFIDYVRDVYAGLTEVRFTMEQEKETRAERVKGFPWVASTRTQDDATPGKNFQQKGFGTRRLIAANAYCMKRFGVPLHSGREFKSEWARHTWERLVEAGSAEYIPGNGLVHEYRFKNV